MTQPTAPVPAANLLRRVQLYALGSDGVTLYAVAVNETTGALMVGGTVTVDTSALATAAKQDTGNTSLASIAGKLPAALGPQASGASLSITPATGVSFAPGPATLYASTALEASAVIRAAACTFRRLTVEVDATAPTGTYYAQVFNSATVPADSTVPLLVAEIDHVIGAADRVTFDAGDAGVSFSAGCSACLSTTRLTKTVSGSYCIFTGTTA